MPATLFNRAVRSSALPCDVTETSELAPILELGAKVLDEEQPQCVYVVEGGHVIVSEESAVLLEDDGSMTLAAIDEAGFGARAKAGRVIMSLEGEDASKAWKEIKQRGAQKWLEANKALLRNPMRGVDQHVADDDYDTTPYAVEVGGKSYVIRAGEEAVTIHLAREKWQGHAKHDPDNDSVDEAQSIKVGDVVAYKASFLRSIGSFTGLGHARGVVQKLQKFGDAHLATVKFDADEPIKILTANLSVVSAERGIADEAAYRESKPSIHNVKGWKITDGKSLVITDPKGNEYEVDHIQTDGRRLKELEAYGVGDEELDMRDIPREVQAKLIKVHSDRVVDDYTANDSISDNPYFTEEEQDHLFSPLNEMSALSRSHYTAIADSIARSSLPRKLKKSAAEALAVAFDDLSGSFDRARFIRASLAHAGEGEEPDEDEEGEERSNYYEMPRGADGRRLTNRRAPADDSVDEATMTRAHTLLIAGALGELEMPLNYKRELVGNIARAVAGLTQQFNHARFVKATGLSPSQVKEADDEDEDLDEVRAAAFGHESPQLAAVQLRKDVDRYKKATAGRNHHWDAMTKADADDLIGIADLLHSGDSKRAAHAVEQLDDPVRDAISPQVRKHLKAHGGGNYESVDEVRGSAFGYDTPQLAAVQLKKDVDRYKKAMADKPVWQKPRDNEPEDQHTMDLEDIHHALSRGNIAAAAQALSFTNMAKLRNTVSPSVQKYLLGHVKFESEDDAPIRLRRNDNMTNERPGDRPWLTINYCDEGIQLVNDDELRGGDNEQLALVRCDTHDHTASMRAMNAMIEYAGTLNYEPFIVDTEYNEDVVDEGEILALEWDSIDDLRALVMVAIEECDPSELERFGDTVRAIDEAINDGDFELAEQLADQLLEYKRTGQASRRGRIRSLRMGVPKSVRAGKMTRSEHKRGLRKRRRLFRTSAGKRSKAKRYAKRYARHRVRLRPIMGGGKKRRSESVDESKSWMPEVRTGKDPKFYGNALRFATKKEAEDNAADLSRRWTLVTDYRASPSDDPVNYKADAHGKATPIGKDEVDQSADEEYVRLDEVPAKNFLKGDGHKLAAVALKKNVDRYKHAMQDDDVAALMGIHRRLDKGDLIGAANAAKSLTPYQRGHLKPVQGILDRNENADEATTKSKPLTVQCGECGNRFQTNKDSPKCPKCKSTDIDLPETHAQKRETGEGEAGLKSADTVSTDEAGDKLGVLAGEVMTFLINRPRTDAHQLQNHFRMSASAATAILNIAAAALAAGEPTSSYDGHVRAIHAILSKDNAFESVVEGEQRLPFVEV